LLSISNKVTTKTAKKGQSVARSLVVPLLLLNGDKHISLGSDGHAGGDGEVVGLHNQWVVVVLEVLSAEPRMRLEIHLTEMGTVMIKNKLGLS
jgi:hypothetical protein